MVTKIRSAAEKAAANQALKPTQGVPVVSSVVLPRYLSVTRHRSPARLSLAVMPLKISRSIGIQAENGLSLCENTPPGHSWKIMPSLLSQQKALRRWGAMLALLSLTQARCGSIVVPTGPEPLSIHLQADFNDDKVVIVLNGDRVFSGRVTTDHIVGVAKMIPLSLPEGMHHIRVSVNGRSSSSQGFVAGSIAVIAVAYDRAEGDVALELLVETPRYD